MNFDISLRTIARRIGTTIVAAALFCGPLASQAQVAAGGPRPSSTTQDNLTYHNTNSRLGWYQNETVLTTSNVGSSAFHLIGTMATKGKSFSQPLYVSNQIVADGTTHNLLIVTDSTNVVYAYDADSLKLIWQRTFTFGGARQQLASDTGCNDIWPNAGINGTPVIDRARGAIYVVVPTYLNGTYTLRLHALGLRGGKDVIPAVAVAATVNLVSGGTASVDPKFNFNRAGLLETNNTIYVSLSTHCDFDSDAAHGWLISYSAATLKQTGSLINVTNKNIGTVGGTLFLGSIWQGGFGIAADSKSNIVFATGNGPNDAQSDYSMSVLQLTPDLNPASLTFFTPSTWQNDSRNDADLGSGGVMLLPDQTTGTFPHLAITGGKTGVKYLLNRDNLGGLHSSDQIPYETNTAGGQFGGPAYFVDSSGNQKILFGGSPNLNAYTLGTAPYGLSLTSATNVGQLENRDAGVTPVVSSNGTQAGSAVVWTIMTPPGNTNGTGKISLYAFDGANLGHTLYTAQGGVWTGNGDTGGALITPLVANGRVYLATDGVVSVFGLQ